MPRRKGVRAAAAADQQRYARWRYLLRNPEFRADLNLLKRACKGDPEALSVAPFRSRIEFRRQLVTKWGLASLPSRAYGHPGRELPELTLDTVSAHEQLFDPEDLGQIIRSPVRTPGEGILDFDDPDASSDSTL